MLFIYVYLCTRILRAAYINHPVLFLLSVGGFVCLYVWDFYFIYNNTLLHSTCTVALLKVGFQYIYIATGDRTNNVNSSFDKHYTMVISRKKLTWYHWEVIGQQFLLEKINEYWCRRSITLRWPIRPNSLGLATYLIQIAAPINFLGDIFVLCVIKNVCRMNLTLMEFKFKALYLHGNALMDRPTVNLLRPFININIWQTAQSFSSTLNSPETCVCCHFHGRQDSNELRSFDR